MLLKICPHCGRPVPIGERCTCGASKSAEAARQRTYDKHKRNKIRAAFYHTKRWRHVRDYVKARANGLDEVLYSKGIIKMGESVHHIIPIADDVLNANIYDPSNLILVSYKTHKRIHDTYDKSPTDKKNLQKILRGIAARAGGTGGP